mgnify:CR=1 FL=1
MTDELASRRVPIEHVRHELEDSILFRGMLSVIGQTIYELRRIHAKPDDEQLPVVVSYESNGQIVSLYSVRPKQITVQVQSEQGRVGYVYDPSAEHTVIVNVYDDPTQDYATRSFGLLPTEENTPQLADVHAYIRDGLYAK